MSTTKNLLVELFVEELPPKVLKKLGEAFANALADSLKAQGLATVQSVVTPFASPRRLAVNVSDVVARAEDRQEYKRVMPVRVAFDPSGQLVPSARKKLASLGASPADEERFERAYQAESIDSEYLHYQATAVGITLAEGLQPRQFIAVKQALLDQTDGEALRKRGPQLLQRLRRQLFDEQFDEQILRRAHHAAFFSTCLAICTSTSSPQALGAIGKPSRARLSR